MSLTLSYGRGYKKKVRKYILRDWSFAFLKLKFRYSGKKTYSRRFYLFYTAYVLHKPLFFYPFLKYKQFWFLAIYCGTYGPGH